MNTVMEQYACEFNDHVNSLNSLFGDGCGNNSSSESLLTLLNGGIQRQSQSEYLKPNMNKSFDTTNVGSAKKHKKNESENTETLLDSTIERLYFKIDDLNKSHDKTDFQDVTLGFKSKKKHKKMSEIDGESFLNTSCSDANVPEKHKHKKHKFNSDEIVSKSTEDVDVDVVGKKTKKKKHKSDSDETGEHFVSRFSEEVTDNLSTKKHKKHVVISENQTLEPSKKKKRRHKEHATLHEFNANESSEQVEDHPKLNRKHKTSLEEIVNDAPPVKEQKKKKNRKKHAEENLENIIVNGVVTDNRANLFSPKKCKKQVDLGENEVTLEPLRKKKKKHKEEATSEPSELTSPAAVHINDSPKLNRKHSSDEVTLEKERRKKKSKKHLETKAVSGFYDGVTDNLSTSLQFSPINHKKQPDANEDGINVESTRKKKKKHKEEATSEPSELTSPAAVDINDSPKLNRKNSVRPTNHKRQADVNEDGINVEATRKKKKKHKEKATTHDLNAGESFEHVYKKDSPELKKKHKDTLQLQQKQSSSNNLDLEGHKSKKVEKKKRKHEATSSVHDVLTINDNKKHKKRHRAVSAERIPSEEIRKKRKERLLACLEFDERSYGSLISDDKNSDAEENVRSTNVESNSSVQENRLSKIDESKKLKQRETEENTKRKKHEVNSDTEEHKKGKGIEDEQQNQFCVSKESKKSKKRKLESSSSAVENDDGEAQIQSANNEEHTKNKKRKSDGSFTMNEDEVKKKKQSEFPLNEKREVNSDSKEHNETETNIVVTEDEQQQQFCTSKEHKKSKKRKSESSSSAVENGDGEARTQSANNEERTKNEKHKSDGSFTMKEDRVKKKKQSESLLNENRQETTKIPEKINSTTQSKELGELHETLLPSKQRNEDVNLSVPEHGLNDNTVSEKERKESRVRTEHETTQEGIKHSPGKIKRFRKKKDHRQSDPTETTDDETQSTGSTTFKKIKKTHVRKGTMQDETGNVSHARKGSHDSYEKNAKLSKNKQETDSDGSFTLDIDDDDTRLQADEVAMLKDLHIDLPFDVPLSHSIETRMSSCPTKQQQQQFKNLGIKLKTGPYTSEEDQIIINNWHEFCTSNNLPPDNPQLFFTLSFNNKPILPTSERTKFVQFLGRKLENRMLYSIYRRFTVIFNKSHKKGKFTKKEDDAILNFMKNSHLPNEFSALSKILGRPRDSIKHHYDVLIQRDEKCNWTLDLMKELIDNIMEVTKRSVIDDLKDFLIEKKHWQKIEHKMNISATKLKMKWLHNIYPRLFTEDSESLQDIRKKLINVLYDEEEDSKAIDWNIVALDFDGMTGKRLYKIFRDLRDTHVPKQLQTKFRDTVDYLKNGHLILSKDSAFTRKSKMKQLVYHHGYLIEV